LQKEWLSTAMQRKHILKINNIEGGVEMKQYTDPEMNIEVFTVENVILTGSNDTEWDDI